MKKCTVCKIELPFSSFHKSKKSSDGLGYRCRECDKKARHSYREANRERFAEVSRRKQIKFKYGITLEDYTKMFEDQGRCCAICGTTKNAVGGKERFWNFSVDHCHRTGKNRGILCNQCNRGVGMLGDTSEALLKAYNYLKKHETH